jgi:DNA-binding protein HU-beta
MALTQAQLLAAVADRAEFTKPPDTERVLDALEEIVLVELSNAQKIRIGGLVQLTVRVRPAQKKRPGRNPATGEAITIAAKPAQRRCPRSRLGAGEGSAAIRAEGPPAARCLTGQARARAIRAVRRRVLSGFQW